MMHKKLGFALMGAVAHADLVQMAKDLGVLANGTDNPQGRSFGATWAQQMLAPINGYGCWCYFQDDHGKGKGIPANEMDEVCRVLHEGYECIIFDAEQENDLDCVPWDEPYKSGSGLGLAADDPDNVSSEAALRKECFASNKRNKCAARSCAVENYFVVNVFKLFMGGTQLDYSLKHSLGKFDPKDADSCPIKNVDAPLSERECCGLYPLRKPFKINGVNGARGCCGAKTYNKNMLQCCAGDKLKMTC